MADITVRIEGMSCQHCVMRVKKAIEALPGVEKSDVTIGQAVVKFDEKKVGKKDIEKAITEAGYRPVG